MPHRTLAPAPSFLTSAQPPTQAPPHASASAQCHTPASSQRQNCMTRKGMSQGQRLRPVPGRAAILSSASAARRTRRSPSSKGRSRATLASPTLISTWRWPSNKRAAQTTLGRVGGATSSWSPPAPGPTSRAVICEAGEPLNLRVHGFAARGSRRCRSPRVRRCNCRAGAC